MTSYLAILREFERRTAEPARSSCTAPSWLPRDVPLGERRYPLTLWDGHRLDASLIAIDTETEVIDGPAIPRLAMVQVSDGTLHALLHPRDLSRFLRMHHDATLCGHNLAGFDWWVLYHHLERSQERWALDLLWDTVISGRLRDTMVRARLLQLALEGECPHDVGLAALTKRYLGVDLHKDDTRCRFGEALNQPWEQLDHQLFVYAAQDVIATYLVSKEQDQEVQRLITRYRIADSTIGAYGPLSEQVQIKGIIAIQAMHRFGVNVDRQLAVQAEAKLHESVAQAVRQLEAVAGGELFARRVGKLIEQKQGYSRQGKGSALQSQFEQVEGRLGIRAPRSARGVSTDRRFWEDYRHQDPFLEAWFDYQEKSTEIKFYTNLQRDRLHPRYDWLKRTGRTSCINPNLQNAPRTGEYRHCIVPRAGHVFLIADFQAIEMATLAKACLVMFGESRLAEVLQQGQDVHAFTAAMMKGWTVEQYQEFAQTHPREAKAMRQAAKAINFGCPGGLGAARLQAFARHKPYCVDLTLEEAQARKMDLVHHIYPELGRFLEEDSHKTLAWNLEVTRDQVVDAFGESLGPIRRVVEGDLTKPNGTSYRQDYVQFVWSTLSRVNASPRWVHPLCRRDSVQCQKLFRAPTVTITGRIRNYANYCDWRNTRFQGPASCGAKLCLFELVRAGHRPVLFVHDEVVCEVPEDEDLTRNVEQIVQICESQMFRITDPIPVSMSYAVARRWYKEAELVRDQQGRIQVWEPSSQYNKAYEKTK